MAESSQIVLYFEQLFQVHPSTVSLDTSGVVIPGLDPPITKEASWVTSLGGYLQAEER